MAPSKILALKKQNRRVGKLKKQLEYARSCRGAKSSPISPNQLSPAATLSTPISPHHPSPPATLPTPISPRHPSPPATSPTPISPRHPSPPATSPTPISPRHPSPATSPTPICPNQPSLPSSSSTPINPHHRSPHPSTSTPQPSASKKKLGSSSPSNDLPRPLPDSEQYVMVNVSSLNNLFQDLVCPLCKHTSALSVVCQQAHTMGMAAKLFARCENCEQSVAGCNTSKKITSHVFDVNRRVALAFANLGLGHAALQSFCEVFGMKPLGETAFSDSLDKICESAEKAKSELLDKAAVKIRAAYQEEFNTQPNEDGVLDITVSYDGSWHTRGHRSKHGLGCVVDSITGLVIDYEAMSIYCQRCEIIGAKIKERNEEDYNTWFANHLAICDANHTGSSGAMEVEAAKKMWGRSLERKFRYTTMISDGDCKTHKELLTAQPYGQSVTIRKEECINHFSKRVGTNLRNMISSEKSRGVTLGGNKKGSLTMKKIETLQKYFQKAILSNLGCVEGMRKAVWATYYHAASTDKNPMHQDCPTSKESWCPHNKALAQNLPPPGHKSSVSLNEKVAECMKPVYERLTSDELLGRCLQGKTQNANESLHAVIWGFCPKHTFVGVRRVKLALYLGSGQFNVGSTSLRRLIKELGIDCFSRTATLGQKRDQERIERAEKYATELQRKNREKKTVAHLRALAAIKEAIPAYLSGAH